MKKFAKCSIIALLVAAGSLAYAGPQTVGSAGNPKIIPPQAMAYGKSYGQWNALFWQWLFACPVSENPLFLDGNVDLSLHQPDGPVWFLGGMMVATPFEDGFIGQAVRSGTVPAGKALFFPVINNEFDNQTFLPPEDMTIPELQAFAANQLNGASAMYCVIDGVPVQHLWDPVSHTSPYRAPAPVFSYWLPATDNVQQFWGLDVSGSIAPAVADGVYLMLAPLPVGNHTIHLGGTNSGFILDVTYNITVVPATER